MLTQESRARNKQKEAVESERKNKYNKASSLYSIAKVIWQRVKGSKLKQKFCDARKKHCEAMSLNIELDDDDDEIF